MSFDLDYGNFFELAVPGASNMFWYKGMGVGPFEDEIITGWITGEISVEDLKAELERYYRELEING